MKENAMKERPLIQTAAQQMLAAGMTPRQGADEILKAMIVEALKENRGNICRTARALHMHRNTLSRRVVELQIADVAKECRTDRQSQRSLKYGGRLPMHSPALRKLAQNNLNGTGDRSRVA
jgi:transposase-like protein